VSDRTPKTSTVKHGWAVGHLFARITEPEERYAEFDRWLARHDGEVVIKVVNRMNELLIHKGEYQDVFGLAYIGELVQQEMRGEIEVVIKDAQVYGIPIVKGEQK
jgi:hypothetical protein